MKQFEIDPITLAKLEKHQKYDLYLMYNTLDERIKKYYPQIRFGVKERFDIYDVFMENLTEKAKDGFVYIRKTQEIPFKKFFTEMEERNKLMDKAILEAQIDEGELKFVAREKKTERFK